MFEFWDVLGVFRTGRLSFGLKCSCPVFGVTLERDILCSSGVLVFDFSLERALLCSSGVYTLPVSRASAKLLQVCFSRSSEFPYAQAGLLALERGEHCHDPKPPLVVWCRDGK